MALSKCNVTKGKEPASIQLESNTIEGGAEMDPNLWGDLQNHIDIKMAYEKLPLQAFFVLRRVCKSWNAMAGEDNRSLLPKPYFVSMHFSWSNPNIVAFDIPSGRWVWNPLGQLQRNPVPWMPRIPTFALHGMLYSSYDPRMSSYVLDAHTGKEYTLPPLRMRKHSWDNMVVDTTVTPHKFKVIRGAVDVGTQIFDSEDKVWTMNFSQPLRLKSGPPNLTTCANLNGRLYIRFVAPDIITVYDVVKVVWSELQPPQQLPGCRTCGGSLGTWQGKLLTVVEHHNGESFDSVVICEHDGETQQWKEFLAMPAPLYKSYY